MSNKPTERPKLGLKQRILTATTTAQLDELMAEGATFQQASPATQRSWRRAYQRRTLELK